VFLSPSLRQADMLGAESATLAMRHNTHWSRLSPLVNFLFALLDRSLLRHAAVLQKMAVHGICVHVQIHLHLQ
jgi:hypothetical protein